MTDERASFETTKARLDEIVVEVGKKDTSLERSIDLLEEGVRLMNTCNEVIDQTWWRRAEGEDAEAEGAEGAEGVEGADGAAEGSAPEAGGPADDAAEEPADEADGDDDEAGEGATSDEGVPAEELEDDERS